MVIAQMAADTTAECCASTPTSLVHGDRVCAALLIFARGLSTACCVLAASTSANAGHRTLCHAAEYDGPAGRATESRPNTLFISSER
jgi:hypothetical protein